MKDIYFFKNYLLFWKIFVLHKFEYPIKNSLILSLQFFFFFYKEYEFLISYFKVLKYYTSIHNIQIIDQ